MNQLAFEFNNGRKITGQKRKILELLLAHRGEFVSNIDLNKIAFRYGARIHELIHKHGFNIVSRPGKGGEYFYRLES